MLPSRRFPSGSGGSLGWSSQRFMAAAAAVSFLVAFGLSESAPSRSDPPKLELYDRSGQRHSLEDYRGRVVVLNFWATWCPPCVKEMPFFVEAAKRFEDRGVTVIAASLDTEETAEEIPAFVERHRMEFPVLVDASPDHLDEFGLQGVLPGTVFLDTDGTVVFRIIGEARRRDIFQRIEWLLGNRRGRAPSATLSSVP